VPLKLDHPAFESVDAEIFTQTFTPDCMAHACVCREENDRQRNDACCRFGADVLIPEKAAILRRAPQIAAVLKNDRRDPAGWFDETDPEEDPDAPGGILLRTATQEPGVETSGCVFLDHDGQRGCALHRAALQFAFDPAEIKPAVCRLYPLSASRRRLRLSPDFDWYSCAGDAGPTVYRLMRGELASIYGDGLVTQLDRLEREHLRRRLRVAPRRAPAQASDG
jgi:Fe-S-cluster containining protein